MSKLGYPGINGPDAPKKDEEDKGDVISSNTLHSLVRRPDGEVVIIDNRTGQRAGKSS